MNRLKAIFVATALFSMAAPTAMAGKGYSRAQVKSARTAKKVRPQRQRQVRHKRPVPRRTQSRALRERTSGLSAQVKRVVSSYKQMMEGAIARNATPPWHVIPTKSGVQMKQTRESNYKKNITPAYTVSGVGSAGELALHALLPVSGHTGQAQQFAKSNQYNVKVTHADGSVQNLGKIASTGLVTEKALSVKLKKGKTVIEMWPDGSAGVAGFKSGRQIELNWNGD